jgi:hypothetical protein
MRQAALILVLAFATTASAEKIKTNQATTVYAHPGERGKVVLKVKSGQNMTVLAKEGRWIKVRVQGRTGYVARSTVDLPDSDDIARNTRRRPFVDGRGTKRGFGGEAGPDDRVGADAAGDGDDGDKADKPGKDDDDDDKKPKKARADKPSKDDDDKKPKKARADKPSKDDDDDDKKPKKARADKPSKDDDEEAVVVDEDKDGDDSNGDKGDTEADRRPVAHVSAKTVAYNDPTSDSDEAFTAKPSMVLYPGETKGKWTFVEAEEGDAGWVLSSQLDLDGDGGTARQRQLAATARLGVMFLSQGLKSAGSTIVGGAGVFNVDNYTVGTSAMQVALGGELLYPYGKKYVLGGEAGLEYAKTVLGGVHIPATMTTPAADTGVSLTVLDLRFVAGYDLHKKSGMTLFGRLGYRYQGFLVDEYNVPAKNPAQLPQEVLQGPTLGGALGIPKLTDKIGLKLTLDMMVIGASVTQTKGFEDGKSPSAKAFLFGGVFRYRWKKDMDLQGTYNLEYGSYDFGAPLAGSMRMHTGTDTTRTDVFHTLTFGILKGF